MQREIATSQPILRTGVLPSWFSFERCSGTTTNDHRLACHECAVPPGIRCRLVFISKNRVDTNPAR